MKNCANMIINIFNKLIYSKWFFNGKSGLYIILWLFLIKYMLHSQRIQRNTRLKPNEKLRDYYD